jgi:uncharacterized membrane protein
MLFAISSLGMSGILQQSAADRGIVSRRMDLIVLIFFVCVMALIISVIVMPVVVIRHSIGSRKKISALEARIDRLEAVLAPQPKPPSAEPAAPSSEPEPPPVTRPAFSASQIESMIGRRWIGWIAISLILFATAFFLKYAFENRWINEVGRVAIGVAFGIGMSIAGFRYRQRGWRMFSQMLTAGGIILLYLSIYAAFAYYQLVGQKTAFIYLIAVIAEAAILALIYNAPAIAIMALVGGFLTPLLLRSDQDQYRSFFTYIVALDIGALALLKQWRGLSSVAYFGTQFLFWIWYNENYEPQKRTAVLVFQTAVFFIFLLAHFGRTFLRRESATNEDALLLVVNPFIFFVTVYTLMNPAYHEWMGAFAVGMALLYGSGAMLLPRLDTSRREGLLLVAIALTFVAIAIPIQLRANWITIGWAVEGLAILWAALQIGSLRLRAHAFVLFALAFFRLLLWDTPYGPRAAFIPVFNRYFLSSLIVIGCFLGAIYLYERARERNVIDSGVPRLVMGLAATIAFWFVISVETHTFFTARALAEKDPVDMDHQRWLGQMALSVVWAAYAGALAALGFIRRAAAVRWASLVLFAVTIIKAMLIDLAELQQLYRIIVFFVLGVLLLLVTWAYHKVFHLTQERTKGT